MQDLTNTKLAALEQEYDNLQHYLQTREGRGLYSANKQQADKRKIQGLFHCSKCGDDNADRNAAFNIGHRGLGHASNLGIIVSVSRTFPSIDRNAMMRKEATDSNRW